MGESESCRQLSDYENWKCCSGKLSACTYNYVNVLLIQVSSEVIHQFACQVGAFCLVPN